MSSAGLPKIKSERIVHETIPSTMELADDSFMLIKGACKGAEVPKKIKEEGGPFGTICLFKVKRGQGDKVMEALRKVHQETDDNELSVYSHRVMRGFGDAENYDMFSIIIEYDNVQAFYDHYYNNALQELINSGLSSTRPKISFFRELDS
ncbi:hypothetical protein BDY24DRAFT_397120 [Mrakia frigida]|uniref:uncharacterized protein n=1 Tax=Mrakia frigida TaxID=29902 RepID=UPI003FCBFD35